MTAGLVLGQPTWKRVFGGSAVEQVWDVAALGDGGFAVVGSTGSFGAASSDIYLLKLNADGERLWSQLLGGPGVDEGKAVVEMANGDLLIAGFTNAGTAGGYDGLVLRTDAAGEVIWERSFGGADWDFFHGIARDLDDGVWVVGTTYSMGVGGDAWLLHLDSGGEVLHERALGSELEDHGASVKATADGGCVIAGSQVTGSGDLDLLVVKLDSDGEEVWTSSFGGDEDDAARDIEVTTDGGYSVVGWTRSFNPVVEFYHVRMDASGEEDWYRNWGQVADQEGFDHVQLDNGEYASIGYVSQGGAGGKDMFLMKNGTDGGFILGQTQGGPEDEFGHAIVRAEGGYVIAGTTRSYGQGQTDIMVIRTNEVGFTDSDQVIAEFDPVSVVERPTNNALVYPNPSVGSFRVRGLTLPIQWRLTDSVGRVVRSGILTRENEEVWTDQPGGSYLLHCRAGQEDLHLVLIITR
ncbi:MAG: hypothetical protein H6590_05185 [Flavobacteriales bacterium]|nr:hypothetical protein [Flavobacteriales bacterium]